MRSITRSSAFRKNYKRLQKRGFEMSRLLAVIETLANEQILEDRFHDHPLRGNYDVGASAMLRLIGCSSIFFLMKDYPLQEQECKPICSSER
jgi:hypothetical protein